jgi:hypothetical protein
MGKKSRLSLINDRFQQPGSLTPSNVRPNRLQDSTEMMDYTPPPGFAGGVQIPFLTKPVVVRSFYSNWRTGKIRIDSSKQAPVIDNKGRNFICGNETRNIKFSERDAKSFDYGANEAARTYYCKPERIDCPSMNRVLDNLQFVSGETISDRVEMGKVEGASWSVVPRMQSEASATSHIGPGHYNIHGFEGKYGPLSSNMLLFSVVDAGRGADDTNYISSTQRRRERNKLIDMEENPGKYNKYINIEPSDDIVGAKSTLNTIGGNFTKMNRWKDPIYKEENYVKTSGLKLDLDYDPHLDRKKLPMTFTTTPQRGEIPKLLSKNTDYTVDYGNKESMQKKALTSPVKYSMAFNSKAAVGMEIPIPTSGVNGGPGSFPKAFPSVTNIYRPDHKSYAFISVKTEKDGAFPTQEPNDKSMLDPPNFSQINQKGPTFPKGSSGASDAIKKRVETQVKSIYPKLANKIWPKPKVVVDDPFKYLKPLKK